MALKPYFVVPKSQMTIFCQGQALKLEAGRGEYGLTVRLLPRTINLRWYAPVSRLAGGQGAARCVPCEGGRDAR
eukprot:5355126-Prymnesium_polylepis.1